jgi:Tol biopolymer transport system component
LFSSDKNGQAEIWTLDVNSADFKWIGVGGVGIAHPDYNMRTRQLTYSSMQTNANVALYKNYPANGGIEKINELESSKWEREAVFSNNGEFIAYVRLLTDGSEVWLYDIETGEQKRLLKQKNSILKGLSWSNDDKKILLEQSNGDKSSVYVLDIQRQHFYQLAINDLRNQFSPIALGDDKILFTSKQDEQWQIWQADKDGSNVTLITASAGAKIALDDSGEKVYFSREGEKGIWQILLNKKSTSPEKLTEKISVEFQSWKYRDGKFYYLESSSAPSDKIYQYDPSTDKEKKLVILKMENHLIILMFIMDLSRL